MIELWRLARDAISTKVIRIFLLAWRKRGLNIRRKIVAECRIAYDDRSPPLRGTMRDALRIYASGRAILPCKASFHVHSD